MKIFTYFLIACLAALFGWCGDENEDCTKLPKPINIIIYVELVDDYQSKTVCEEQWAVDFWKVHCGGGPSGTFSYLYKGCYEHEDKLYVKKEGIGSISMTFEYEEDRLHIDLIDYTGKIIFSGSNNGKRIYDETNEGAKALSLRVVLSVKGPIIFII